MNFYLKKKNPELKHHSKDYQDYYYFLENHILC